MHPKDCTLGAVTVGIVVGYVRAGFGALCWHQHGCVQAGQKVFEIEIWNKLEHFET